PLIREYNRAKDIIISTDAFYLAEGGSEDAIFRLKNDLNTPASWTIVLNNATTTVTVVTNGGNKEITSVANRDSYVRKVKAIVSSTETEADFYFGAQVGEGGISMGENSQITGSIMANGTIQGDLANIITGDVIVSSSIEEDMAAQSIACNQDQIVGKANLEIDFAQSFVPSETKKLSKISLYIKKVGVPGDRTISIVADNAGVPDTTSLADGVLDKDLVGAGYAWVDVSFPTPADLVSGQTYWIVFDSAKNSNHYWIWCRDSAGGYGDGAVKYSEDWDNDPWTDVVGDMTFKTYLGEGFSGINKVHVQGTAKANTIINSIIDGEAYYQTISGSTVGGTSYPGSPNPPGVSLPLSDENIASWKSDAEVGGTIVGDYLATTEMMGPKKIDGNFSIVGGDVFTMSGVVYITGNIEPGVNAVIQCDPLFGEQSCVLISDGYVDISNNVAFSGSGNSKSYLMILTTAENCLGGVQTASCGPENSAIYIKNNATGAIFYASDSLIHISNGVNLTSAVGYKFRLDNTAKVIY
ncbi:MAG: hypothetical protein KAI72_10385, partial [Candidatus Pacebacteria bacterium]|nr:hypothetical protein [Candidatus Paceibacterota bacterium]